MGVAPENQRPDVDERFEEQAERFFDAQRERLQLNEAQIRSQDITDLEDSRVRAACESEVARLQ